MCNYNLIMNKSYKFSIGEIKCSIMKHENEMFELEFVVNEYSHKKYFKNIDKAVYFIKMLTVYYSKEYKSVKNIVKELYDVDKNSDKSYFFDLSMVPREFSHAVLSQLYCKL